jgi:hypothetical protein
MTSCSQFWELNGFGHALGKNSPHQSDCYFHSWYGAYIPLPYVRGLGHGSKQDVIDGKVHYWGVTMLDNRVVVVFKFQFRKSTHTSMQQIVGILCIVFDLMAPGR